MILVNDQRYWLYAAVDPAMNCLLHGRLYTTRTTADKGFLRNSAKTIPSTMHSS